MEIVTFTNKRRRTYRHEPYDGITKPLRQVIIDIIKKTQAKGEFYIVFSLEESLILEQILLTYLIGKYSSEDILDFLNNSILRGLKKMTTSPLITATYIPEKGTKLVQKNVKYKLALRCEPGIKNLVKDIT